MSRIDTVKSWFKGTIDSEAGQDFVTDDITFTMPPSGEEFLLGNRRWNGKESLRRLGILDHALYASYGQPSTMNLHFMIEDGDWVLMQFDSKFTGHGGEKYHNFYAIAIRFVGDKIAETVDLADTAYLEETLLGTPDQYQSFNERINAMRSEANAPEGVW